MTTTADPKPTLETDATTIARGEAVNVQASCSEPLAARAGDVDLEIVDGAIDTLDLGVGDHLVVVSCADETVLEVDLMVVEPVSGRSSGPATAIFLLLFSFVGGFIAFGSPGSAARRAIMGGS